MGGAMHLAESDIVGGTWALVWVTVGLVAVTLGLVVVALVEARQAAQGRSRASQRDANRIVPEIASLRARLVEACRIARLNADGDASALFKDTWIPGYRRFANELFEYRDATLAYSNEVLLVRHFLRLAEQAWTARDVKGGEGWNGVALNLTAARLALDAAVTEIPEKLRTIAQEEYWLRSQRSSRAHLDAARSELWPGS